MDVLAFLYTNTSSNVTLYWANVFNKNEINLTFVFCFSHTQSSFWSLEPLVYIKMWKKAKVSDPTAAGQGGKNNIIVLSPI